MDTEQKRLFPDNPNPNAKIGFVIFYPFQFYVQKNIYKHLGDDVEFIIDLGAFFPVEQPNELLVSIIALLRENNAHFRILHYEYYFYPKALEKFFAQYEVLVSLWERGCLRLECNLAKKKVRLGYGSGKELTMYRPSGGIYDLTLAYGERDSKAFSLFCETQIVGIPKFDDWFNEEFDENLLGDLRKRLDPNKKTVLYLPTHSDLGSIKDLADPLRGLVGEYNIVVKLHYLNITDEPELVQKLEHPHVILLKDDADLLSLLKISDVVLSDNSSAIFDAILADKPVVVTDFFDKEYLNVLHKKIKRYRRGSTSALTYSGSIEQTIKRDGLVITIQSPSGLGDGIKRGLIDEPFYKAARKRLNEELSAFNDGKCGERAAKAIYDLLNRSELPEKPPLYHAFKVYENNLKKVGTYSKWRENMDKISEYESLLIKRVEEERGQRIVFSIVVIYDRMESGLLKPTLRSLLGQEFDHKNYEVIIVNGPDEREIAEIVKEIPEIQAELPVIKCVAAEKGDAGASLFRRAIDRSAGEIVCFTQSGCIADPDWLLRLFLTYKKYPDIAGVGGYSVKQRSAYTMFDEYYYLELGRRTGMAQEGRRFLSRLYEIKNNLFYQNPAGMLANMSYKKDALMGVSINYSRITTAALLEMLIKRVILQDNRSICFIPSSVKSLEMFTYKKFARRNFEEGFAYHVFSLASPSLKRYYPYGLFSIIKIPLANIFSGYFKVRLTWVIFIGALFRWFGSLYGRLALAKNRIDREREWDLL